MDLLYKNLLGGKDHSLSSEYVQGNCDRQDLAGTGLALSSDQMELHCKRRAAPLLLLETHFQEVAVCPWR